MMIGFCNTRDLVGEAFKDLSNTPLVSFHPYGNIILLT